KLRVRAAGAKDRGAGTLDRLAQRARQRRLRQRGFGGEGIVRAQPGGDQLLLDGLHRQPAGGLTARVATHAVADDVQPEVLVDEEAVLVVLALHADVTARGAAILRHAGQVTPPCGGGNRSVARRPASRARAGAPRRSLFPKEA